MLIFAIIIAIIAVILCAAAAIYHFSEENYGVGCTMILLAVLNAVLCVSNIEKYTAKRDGELETKIVKNVVEYHVDSVIVINGADTTKTYTLTYLK